MYIHTFIPYRYVGPNTRLLQRLGSRYRYSRLEGRGNALPAVGTAWQRAYWRMSRQIQNTSPCLSPWQVPQLQQGTNSGKSARFLIHCIRWLWSWLLRIFKEEKVDRSNKFLKVNQVQFSKVTSLLDSLYTTTRSWRLRTPGVGISVESTQTVATREK